MQVLARLENPSIVLLDGLLSEAECEQLAMFAEGRLSKSTVVDDATGAAVIHHGRTSEGTGLQPGDCLAADLLQCRAAIYAGLSTSHAESVQVMRYRPGQRYDAHYDYFSESSPNLAQGGQRVATVLMYLRTPEGGGQTQFPHVHGLSITPRAGMAVYFEYGGEDREKTLHASLPVTEGEKMIATVWLRQRPVS